MDSLSNSSMLIVERGDKTEIIQDWIVAELSELLDLPIHQITIREPISSFHLTWIEAAIIAGDVGKYLGWDISPTIAYDYPTIEALAQHLAEAKHISG